MNVTYYGHACFSVEIAGKHILFDPFISGNELASDVEIDKIPADYIFLSHGHFDHVQDAESIAKRTGAKVVGPFEVVEWFGEKGIENRHPMNHGGSWEFDFGKVKLVNAVHSSVMPDGSYGGNPCGFVFETTKGTFYYAGDTALHMDMKLIPLTCESLDFAVMPIGDNFTMGVNDAILAAEFVGCDIVVGVHYDTFGYIKLDKEEAKSAFSKAGKELMLPNIGETIDI